MRLKRLIYSIPFFCSIYCQSQISSGDSIKIADFISKARASLDSAPFYLNEVEKLSTTPLSQMTLNVERSFYHLDKNQMDSAILLIDKNFDSKYDLDESKEAKTILARSWYLRRSYLISKGNYHEAVTASLTAIEVYEKNSIIHKTRGHALVNLAIDYWRLKKYDESLRTLDKAIEYSSANNFEIFIRRSYMMKGLVYMDLNKIALAEEYHKRVFEMIGTDVNNNARDYMATCNNIGLIFQEKESYDSALLYYQKALDLVQSGKIHSDFNYLIPYYQAIFTENIAIIYFEKEEFVNAVQFSNRALKLKSNRFGDSHPDLIATYYNLAVPYMYLNEYDKSRENFEMALVIGKRNKVDVAKSYNYLGDLYFYQKKMSLALAYYDSAILTNPSADIDNIKVYSYPDFYLKSLGGKSQILLSDGKSTTNEIDELYQQAKNTITFLLRNSDKLALLAEINTVLEVFYNAYSVASEKGNNTEALKRMWEISELSKGARLRMQLKTQYLLTYSLPELVLERERELKDSIDLHIRQLEPGQTDSSLFVLKRKYDQFISQLEEEYPKYSQLKNRVEIQDLADRRKQLSNGEMLLNFFEGDSTIYIIKFSNKDITSSRVSKNEIEQSIDDLNNSILSNSQNGILKASAVLTKNLELTPEDLKEFHHLYVLPDGAVWKLNFTSLANRNSGEVSYLGNRITFSFNVYSKSEKIESESSQNKIIAFSYNPETDSEIESSPVTLRNLDESLPGTSKEVSAIAKLWNGDYYFANQANETAFKKESNNYSILHLAVHGFLDEIYPENSYLKFSSGDSLNDGRLYAYELYNLNLNAQLAVLSACNSGQGKVIAGEGMMSMGRSFAYSGVQSLLASRWQVPDISTPYIMKYFYKGLKEGMRKSEALKYAQNQFLLRDADNITSSPFYWAGFYIMGDDQPMKQPASKWYLISLFSIIFISVGILIHKRKKS